MTVKEWIIKEQGRHFCKCGCGTEIIINKIHHSRGIPQYIRGHRMRAEKRGLHGWVEEQQGKHFCQCGCNEVIIISRIHHSKGIPKFINGHSWIGKNHSQESKDKQRESKIGKNNVWFGKQHSKETRIKLSDSLKGDKNGMYGVTGDKNPAWKGGLSFEPYCHKFNENVKELIREKYNRMCVMCGKSEEKNGKKLSVHHINYNKQQGCDGHEWKLLPLCVSCHMKTNYNREAWSEKLMLII